MEVNRIFNINYNDYFFIFRSRRRKTNWKTLQHTSTMVFTVLKQSQNETWMKAFVAFVGLLVKSTLETAMKKTVVISVRYATHCI